MKNEPKCPYCGSVMRIDADSCHIWMKCDSCLSCAPKIEKPAIEECELSAVLCAVYWDKCEEIAKKAALRRPIQKPLTLEELHALIRSGEDVAIYCEANDDAHAYATIIYNGKVVSMTSTTINADDLIFERYGITWRAWASRPTDEERAAAQWEE